MSPSHTYPPKPLAYTNRNLNIYEKQPASGIPLSPRNTFHYGRELYYHGRYDSAKTVLSKFLSEEKGGLQNNTMTGISAIFQASAGSTLNIELATSHSTRFYDESNGVIGYLATMQIG